MRDRSTTQHLFLYGTLNPALAPGELREVTSQLTRVGGGTVPGRLYDLGEYPGAVLQPLAATRIRGHVYRVRNEGDVLRTLDKYEEFDPERPADSLFLRVEHAVELDSGSEQRCWVYVYNGDTKGSQLVPEGDYKQWVRTRGTIYKATPTAKR